MSEDRVYKCSLTVQIVKKDHEGQTLDIQQIGVPIMGHADSQYQVSYHIYIPEHYHLASKSPRVVAGKIEVQHGHATLSNDHQTFIYELNSGTLIVRYINQNYQEVGQGSISESASADLASVTHQVSVPRGYHVDSTVNKSMQKLGQSLLIKVEGNSATLQQSALELLKQEVDRHGHSIRRQIRTIHISGRIGDHFSLHPADYRFPHTVPTSKTLDVNGVITPDGVKPFQAKFVYVKYQQPLLSYPLTVKILKKDRGRINSHTVIKQIRGKLHHQYQYSYRDFQPRGFQLSASSLKTVRGQIMEHGLSHPAVAFIYDRIRAVNVKYVNQNHQIVGHSQNQVKDPALNHLQLPQGYVMDDNQYHFNTHASMLVVPVHGKPANQKQNAVRLRIVERQSNGQLISRHSKIVHVSGNIGDYFQIDPAKQCPAGLLNRQNQPITGKITFNGTQVNHHELTYEKPLPRGKILLRYIDQNNRIISQQTFMRKVGSPFNQQQSRQSLPAHYGFVKITSGSQIHRFEKHPQIIMVQVARLLTSSEKAARSSASMQKAIRQKKARPAVQKDRNAATADSSASQAAKDQRLISKVDSLRTLLSAARAQQSSSAVSQSAHRSAAKSTNISLKSNAQYLRSLTNSVSNSASSISSQQNHRSSAWSSQSSTTQNIHGSVHSLSQSASVKNSSESASQQSPKSNEQKSRHVNVVKKAFLYRCYGQIFGTDLLRTWSKRYDNSQQFKMGVQLANDYIHGAADALKGQSDPKERSHSYRYGLKSGAALMKQDPHPTVAKILMKVINRSSLMKS